MEELYKNKSLSTPLFGLRSHSYLFPDCYFIQRQSWFYFRKSSEQHAGTINNRMEFIGIIIMDSFSQEKKLYQRFTQRTVFYAPTRLYWKEYIEVWYTERDDILNLFRVYITGAAIYIVVIIILLLAKYVIFHLVSPPHYHAQPNDCFQLEGIIKNSMAFHSSFIFQYLFAKKINE
jgi:hypothetical protein